jgi:hypothetical protein
MWQHQPSVNFCEPYEQEHIRTHIALLFTAMMTLLAKTLAIASCAQASASSGALSLVQMRVGPAPPWDPLVVEKENKDLKSKTLMGTQNSLLDPIFLEGQFIGQIHEATLTQSNLGGLGPDTGVRKIIFKNAGYIGETWIDVHVENMTFYDGSDTKANGRGGDGLNPYGFINLKCGLDTIMRYTFFVNDTVPVQIQKVFFSFHDLDSGNEGILKEFIGADGYVENYLADNTELVEVESPNLTTTFGGTVWISSTPGNGADNPTNPMHLTLQQAKRTVTLAFDNVSSIDTLYGLTENSGCIGRNLMFSFKTSLVPPDCETCVEGNDGDLTCCAAGGSWTSLCGSANQVEKNAKYYSYAEGKEVCSTPAPTPSPTPPKDDLTCGTCVIWGDPHIITFRDHQKRVAQHPRRDAFFRTREWKSDQITINEAGKFWLVKSDSLQIEGAYAKNMTTGTTTLTQIAIGGPLLGDNILIIRPINGKTTWNEKTILSTLPSKFENEVVQAEYHNGAKMVKDGTNGPGIDFKLPTGVTLTINRWKESLAAEINMCPANGQTGQCGDYVDNAY